MAEEEAKNLETPVVEEATTETAPAETEEKFAKAGKKSKKHIEEVRAEEERQARKAEAAAEPEKKAGPKPVTRSRLERRGTDAPEVIDERVRKAAYELTFAPQFDYILINDDLVQAEEEILAKVKEFLEA